jgi:hypothetical protein
MAAAEAAAQVAVKAAVEAGLCVALHDGHWSALYA